MKICPYKYENYNRNNNCFRTISFTCSNCFNIQLIKGNYVFIGYCESQSYHSSNLDCDNIKDIDEITFICSNSKCQKISFNTLNGNPLYNVAAISKKDSEILQVLLDNKQLELHSLLKEYFLSIILKHNSSATLLARKMLINFAHIIGCEEEGKGFVFYVNFIEQSGILGKKWNSKLDLIRKLGNDENHKAKIASDKELTIIKVIMEQLINAYFLPDLT